MYCASSYKELSTTNNLFHLQGLFITQLWMSILHTWLVAQQLGEHVTCVEPNSFLPMCVLTDIFYAFRGLLEFLVPIAWRSRMVCPTAASTPLSSLPHHTPCVARCGDNDLDCEADRDCERLFNQTSLSDDGSGSGSRLADSELRLIFAASIL